MATSNPEAELIFNRANVALARSQRLIASWLPQTPEPTTNTKSEEELKREEDEMFTPVPEKLGLGAPVPKDQGDRAWSRPEIGSNDNLRKQLLGKNFGKNISLVPKNSRVLSKGKAHRQPVHPAAESDTETEEESRSKLGKRKRKGDDGDNPSASAVSKYGQGYKDVSSANRMNKGGSYLDELLSKRSRKRKGNQDGNL